MRRTGTGVLWLVVPAFFCFVSLSLYSGFREALPSGVRTVWDVAQAVAGCVGAVWGWIVQRRAHRGDLLDPPVPGGRVPRGVLPSGAPPVWPSSAVASW